MLWCSHVSRDSHTSHGTDVSLSPREGWHEGVRGPDGICLTSQFTMAGERPSKKQRVLEPARHRSSAEYLRMPGVVGPLFEWLSDDYASMGVALQMESEFRELAERDVAAKDMDIVQMRADRTEAGFLISELQRRNEQLISFLQFAIASNSSEWSRELRSTLETSRSSTVGVDEEDYIALIDAFEEYETDTDFDDLLDVNHIFG